MNPTRFLCALAALGVATAASAVTVDSGTISGLGARNIGAAAMSGRIAAIAGYDTPDGKVTLFVGAASGGVWKSEDSGTTFKPVFDKQPVQSIGAIAIDPSRHETIWVGSGEAWTRNSVSIGDGIYKSTDGGESWNNMGLPNSERIAKIVVHPKNGNVVYACVPGKLWSDSADRGLYRTGDGGKTWSLILKGANLSTGCAAVSMDPRNPDVLLASLWDFRRKGWSFRSGGDGPAAFSGSGLFRSRDGGKTWTELTPAANKGFPAKPYGRIAVAHAPSNPKIVYAFVESTRSALLRSDDGGQTWQERDRSQWMVWRPFYFANLIVDPKNPERLFKTDGALIVSTDGGRSFSITGGDMHGDAHTVWIDPANVQHVVAGDDGGLFLSYDGGARWWKTDNLPVSQFYHVSVDDQDPYQVYGGLQDNSSWIGDSQYPGGITSSRWERVYYGDGFWAFADPADPAFLYAESQGGRIGRINRKTHEWRAVQPAAGYQEKMRWHWNTPMHLSPNDPGTLYIGSQFLFRSRDHGQSWQRISPDLTTNDPEKEKQEESGGITVDNSAAEEYCTIYSISESPKDRKLIWAGTADGNLQLTRNGGKTWSNVAGNVPGLPPLSTVSWVEASRYDAATAYAAFDRHAFGDMDPWVYRTSDYGKTWTRIVAPAQGVRGYAHVIREDSVRRDLLFLGTEFGLWISLDGGAGWAQFKGGDFPASVAVRDLAVQPRDSDLVIATHGRGIWIVDDLTPLRALTAPALASDFAWLDSRPAQQRIEGDGGWITGAAAFVGENPPDGITLSYYQKTRHLFGKLKLEILDDQGAVVDTLPASPRRGINRVNWTMRVPAPRVPPAASGVGAVQGPRLVPGHYVARMTKNGQVFEQPFDVALDPRAGFTLADRRAQFDAVMRVHALFGQMSDLVDRIAALRGQALGRAATAGGPLKERLAHLAGAADDIRRKIVATREGGAVTGERRLREYADEVYGSLESYEGRPGAYYLERTDVLQRELGDVAQEFATLLAKDLPPANDALAAAALEKIDVRQ